MFDGGLFRYILRYSRAQQITVLLLTLCSFPFLYISLDIPKTIINKAIGGKGAEVTVLGYPLERVEYLLLLCAAFLALVFINGAFKMKINTYKGVIAERMLRRLRFQLYGRILRFPLDRFQRISQGELISMITGEVEPLAGFIGDAVAQPIFQGGTMLTILIFMFVQDPILGAASLIMIPVQAYLIPRMQKKVNQLSKQRVLRVRKLSERIGETVGGVREVRLNGTSRFTLADFSHHLGGMFDLRFEIYQRKFFIKFANNFINQLTVFLFFTLGGLLVIKGNLTLGALVAAISAYKDLSAPWRELLDYYQQYQDCRIKFDQIADQFDVGPGPEADMAKLTAPIDVRPPAPDATLTANGLTWVDDAGVAILSNISFEAARGTSVAVVADGGAKDRLASVLGRLVPPTSGKVSIGDRDLAALDEHEIGAFLAFLGNDPVIFNGTISENVYYSLLRNPPGPSASDAAKARAVQEALAAGNSPHDSEGDWIDYAAAGCRDRVELAGWWLTVMRTIDAEQSLYERALNATIDPAEHPGLVERIMTARRSIGERLVQEGRSDLVNRFDMASFNPYASVLENILFGLPTDERLTADNAARDPFVKGVLRDAGLDAELSNVGISLADLLCELFRDVSPGHPLYERFGFVEADMLTELEGLKRRAERDASALDAEDRAVLLSLAFKLVPERHRLGLIGPELQQKVVAARRAFRTNLPAAFADAIEFFDETRYAPRLSVIGNVLFGRIAYARPGAEAVLRALVDEVAGRLGLREALILSVADLPVGIGGSRLSALARQQIALARCLIKRPRLLILNEALNAVKPEEQARILANIRHLLPDIILIWLGVRPPEAGQFDQVIEIVHGRLRADPGQIAAPEAAPAYDTPNDELQGEIRLLASAKLFSTLDPAELKRLALTSQKVALRAGEILIRRGDVGDCAYLIVSGGGEVLGAEDAEGNAPVIAPFGPGAMVGELALLCNVARTATLRATEDLVALRIAKDTLLQLIEKDAQMAAGLLRVVSQNLVDVLNGRSYRPPPRVVSNRASAAE